MGWFALYVLALVAACSIDDFVEYGGVIGVDDGASEGAFKSQVVDGSQETRLELKTRGAVTLPRGALAEAVEIGIERPADEEAIKLVKPLKDYLAIASAPYVLTPHGTKFKAPVTIEIPVTKQTDKKLVVGWLENEGDKTWKKLGVPNVKDGLAKIAIDHFSVVILLEEERANLAGDEEADGTNAADAGSSSETGPSSGSTSSGSNDAPVPGGYDAASPPGALDAGTGTGTGSWSYDAGYTSYDKDAAAPYPFPYPFPMPEAGAYVPPEDAGYDASAYIPPADAGYDAGSPSVSDAGSKSVDAAKL
jgi:hypothetical protein